MKQIVAEQGKIRFCARPDTPPHPPKFHSADPLEVKSEEVNLEVKPPEDAVRSM